MAAMETEFASAVRSGAHQTVTRLLAAGQPADEPLDAIGTTPLMAAPTLETVDVLLDAGASLAPTVFGSDVLQIVVSDDASAIDDPGARIAVARRLMAHGIPLDRRNEHGWSRLYTAAFAGDVGAVEALLTLGADPNDEPPPLGAACWGSGRPVGDSPDTIQLLAAAGADVHQRDGAGWSLLHAAAMPYSHGDGFESSDGVNLSALAALIRLGVPPDVRGPNGVTSLMLVAESGELEAVDLLLAAGADQTLRDDDGLDALGHARRAADRLTEVLAGASPDTTDAVRQYRDAADRCVNRLST